MSTENRQRIYPALRYADAWAAIGFLERAFGFARGVVFEGPNHAVSHAELHLGTASIGLNSVTPPTDNPWTTVPCGLYVAFPDAAAVNAHHARASAAGARIASPPADTSYGSRDYAAWDLDGHLWGFGTYAYGPEGPPSLWLSVPYANPKSAIEWLGRAFGCEPGLVAPATGEGVTHAELYLAGTIVMAEPLGRDPAAWGLGRQLTCVYVDDPDAHHARAVDAGATIVMPPADTPYGARAYAARDPEGFLWTFGTYRPAGPPSQT